ncbi:MBOAT family O-acyltransferase [Anaerovorax odorimutans]|uniref:MBOAT family O-acyltransferase n=1 Tax=Anaerovorax odorimutans TaxID=109327 RepID=UPI002E8E157E|nr:MBOAT family O-acyltransferase [Anaerovorax odorimutans]
MITNLGILGLFKYSDFFIDNINNLFNVSISNLELALPLGISFYTFQIMSYSIDVYRGKVKAEKNFIDFGAFVALFPQLIAGPIVRYTDINKELKNRKVDFDQIRDGIELFIFGLASKVLIANAIGSLWDEASELGFSNISSPLAWLSILAFTFQIYFDFSGYSLMAIGLGKMLGFNFPKNFNYPYISKSMTEFWRRWHITLGSWFREYLYIPLGGNRKGTLRHYFNLFFVWAVTGFWHGASWNFVFWGLLFFILISLEKLFLLNILEGKHLLSKIFSRVYFIILTMIGWAVFAITDFNDLQLFFSRLFAFDIGTDVVYYIRNYFMVFILAGVFSTPILKKPWEHLNKNGAVRTIILLVLFIITVAYIVDSSYNPFLYFRF